MLTAKNVGLTGLAAALVAAAVLWVPAPASADTTTDQGAGIVIFPKVKVVTDTDLGPLTDTLIELNNLDRDSQTAAHCFYVNANSHCANSGDVCTTALDCPSTTGFSPCVPGWVEINFDAILTANQPLAWSALNGLAGGAAGPNGSGIANGQVPCPGRLGSKCSGNEGTRVPPVSEDTFFIGELKCIQVEPISRFPATCSAAECQNDLAGTATIFEVIEDITDGKSYNAVGIKSAGDNNGDRVLLLGGTNPEYEPCHEVLILNHLFDNAIDPISGVWTASSELTLVPCTEDFLTQRTDATTAQFLVYNEFEQRFSTSRQVRCLFDSPLSEIDTSQSDRSIFNVSVAGTIAGQTRIRGVGGGLVGAATLDFVGGPTLRGGSAYNLNGFGFRPDDEQDIIRVP
jgi:hypothetical protein